MKSVLKSEWNKWLAQPGHIRVVAIEAGELLAGMIAQQGLVGLGQKGYAEAVVGSLLIASLHKENESINMNAQGSGPFKQAIVDASPEGRVRGFLLEQPDASLHTFGEKGLNGPWGSGVLSILYTKNNEGKHPYRGMVAIASGELDEALNDFFRDSEQLLTKVGFCVEFEGPRLTKVRAALVQVLGGASAEETAAVEALTVKDMRALAVKANAPDDLISATQKLLSERPFQLLETRPLEKFCNCGVERIERALVLTGEADAIEALGDDAFIEVICDFCRSQYKISRERIRALFAPDPSRLQ